MEITISFSLEHRIAGHIEEPLYFFGGGRTIIYYNTNTKTRVTSTIIGQQI